METVNILILGKSGVGKSSLLNYLFEENVRETGIGRPVTAEGFFKEQKVLQGVPITLIDSWGMEAGKSEVWFQQFGQFLHEHGAEQRVEEWIHIALYCIDAQGARIEPFEVDVLNRLREAGIEVVVALTKSGGVEEVQLAQLEKTIKQQVAEQMTIVRVNSVEMTLLTGETLQYFGKEQLLATIRQNYFKSLRHQLPIRIEYVMKERVELVKRAMLQADSRKEAEKIATYSLEHFYETITSRVIQEELGAVFQLYNNQLNILFGNSSVAITDMEAFWKEVKEWTVQIVEAVQKVMKGIAIVLLPLLSIPYYTAKGISKLWQTKKKLAERYEEQADELIREAMPSIRSLIERNIDLLEEKTRGVQG